MIERNGRLRAAICDFGQARVTSVQTGLTSGYYGTAQYAAPELLQGIEEFIDAEGRATTMKSDIYAFAMSSLEVTSILNAHSTRSNYSERFHLATCRFQI